MAQRRDDIDAAESVEEVRRRGDVQRDADGLRQRQHVDEDTLVHGHEHRAGIAGGLRGIRRIDDVAGHRLERDVHRSFDEITDAVAVDVRRRRDVVGAESGARVCRSGNVHGDVERIECFHFGIKL